MNIRPIKNTSAPVSYTHLDVYKRQVVSSELLEVLKLSDRVLVVRDGRIVAELTKEEAGQEVIMQYAMGGSSYE